MVPVDGWKGLAMLCPNCNAEVREGAVFCGACGADLTQVAAVAADPTVPEPPVPTAPLPEPTQPLPPAAPQPAYDQAAYQQPAYDPAAYQQAPQQAYDPGAYPQPQPPKKRKTGLIIAIVAVVLLVLCGCVIGGIAAFTPLFSTMGEVVDEPIIVPEEPLVPEEPVAEPVGFATADEAVAAELEAEGIGDWVYQIYDEGGGIVVYWAGPPASEWVYEITVWQSEDGSWVVNDIVVLDYAGDVSDGDLSPYDQAIDVVGEHLYAVKEDRGLDAQAFTVDPFRSDPASAQEADGALTSFEVLEPREQSDGSFWVPTIQNWTWGTEQWEYWVVPTELGYRIADIRPY